MKRILMLVLAILWILALPVYAEGYPHSYADETPDDQRVIDLFITTRPEGKKPLIIGDVSTKTTKINLDNPIRLEFAAFLWDHWYAFDRKTVPMPEFSDRSSFTQQPTFAKSVENLAHFGVIHPQKDGSFGWGKTFTRRIAAKWILHACFNAKKLVELHKAGKIPSNTFRDISPNDPDKFVIDILQHCGVIEGYPDGTFRLDEDISGDDWMYEIDRWSRNHGVDLANPQGKKNFLKPHPRTPASEQQ
jgi:hypothetical protein